MRQNRFGATYTGVVPGFEDLADPTADEVIDAANLVANATAATLAHADGRHCTDTARYTSEIAEAVDGLHQIVDSLESGGGVVGQTHIELARLAFTRIKTAHDRYTVNALNFRLGALELAAAALCRVTAAAALGTCVAGQNHPARCWATPERLRLRVTDMFGAHDDQDPGCVWHVAEQMTRWDPAQVQRTLIGPPDAAHKVRKLADAMYRVLSSGQLPREFDEGQRAEAARAAGIDYPGEQR